MNYLIMKSIIDTTISHYQCKACGSKVSERDVAIIDSGKQGVNMEIHCSQCHDIATIKAEINVINSPIDIEKLSHTGAIFAKAIDMETNTIPEKLIEDEDILQLRNRLKQNTSVEDLFN